MCGRYAVGRRSEELVELFDVDDPPPVPTAPDHNVAPGRAAPVVLERPGADGRGPTRLLRPLIWGLVPSWARSGPAGRRMINARSESVLERPAFRGAVVRRRCLVPADGWYEWQREARTRGRGGRAGGRPYYIRPREGGPVALAGLHEQWWGDGQRRGPEPAPDGADGPLRTFAVLTTGSEADLEPIHDRMPVVLPPGLWDAWLDPDLRDPHEILAMLRPAAPGRFVAEPVSTRVNSPSENGPDLVLPVADRHGDPRPAQAPGGGPEPGGTRDPRADTDADTAGAGGDGTGTLF